jgi:hypothetical protein
MWKKLYDSLDIKPAAGKAFAKPAAADLDKVEAKIKAKLPASYREYAQVFGAGELGGYFRINVPLPKAKSKMNDLAGLVAFAREEEELYTDTYGDEAFVKRMIPFGTTTGGDILAWDPKAVTDKADNEYAVVVLPNGRDKIVKAFPDFKTFVTKGALGSEFAKAIKYKGTWDVKKEFLPWGDKTPGV